MKDIKKNRLLVIILILVCSFSFIGGAAAAIAYSASEISFKSDKTNATTVEEALNELNRMLSHQCILKLRI